MPAGVHSITWDGRDERGGRAGAGVYFAMLKHEGLIRITRIVRLP
jgi:flagellar hook assembly protein FlgD